MAESLVLGDSIELLGLVPSTNPACAGAIFTLADPFDFGAPQPTPDLTASMILDGEKTTGRRASNRAMSLPVVIRAPTRRLVDAAREVLLEAIDAQQWTMTYTMDPGDGTTPLPLVFDCQRADATVITWSLLRHKQRVSDLVLSFQAAPYGRSDTPVIVDFPSPLAGRTAPAAPVIVDQFGNAPGNWLTGDSSTFETSAGGWTATGGCTIAPSTTQAHTGSQSLALTSTAGGTMTAHGPVSVLALPVVAGQGVTVGAWLRADSVARSAAVTVDWYDGALNPVSSATGTAANDSTTAFVPYLSSFTAPAGAAFAVPGARVAAAGAGEIHYADDVTIAYQWAPSLIGPGPTSAHYDPSTLADPTGAHQAAVYANNSVGPLNLTGQAALTLMAGFGSSHYFANWGRAGGTVRFAFTLTDGTTSITFAVSQRGVKGSSNAGVPKWTKIRVAIPQNTPVNLAAITGWGVRVTNRAGGDLVYTDLYLDSLIAQPVPLVPGPVPQRGTLIDLAGVLGTARAPASWQFQQQGTSVLVTKIFATPGVINWLAPPGVTQTDMFGIGAGGDGAPFFANGGGAGSGGSSGLGSAIPVTPGRYSKVIVGSRGINGGPGGLSSFTSDLGTVITCPGGLGTTTSTGALAPAAGTSGQPGGKGGNGTAATTGGGGGGGGAAGIGAGGAGGNASGGTGGAPGAGGGGPPFGGIGGRGGTKGVGNAAAPATGYGGGLAGSPGGGFGRRNQGGFADGYVQLTYLQPPSAKTLIVHRPDPDQPDTYCPFVSPNFTDTPDGTTEYPFPSPIPGLPARFNGTYTVIAVNYTWDSPTVSRNLFVTINQYEQASGAVQSYSTPTKTFVPSTDPDVSLNGICVLGEITLPQRRIPAENQSGIFTATITDSNVNDRFLDILLLSTSGSTLIVNSSQPYTNYFVEEPADTDIGLVAGSLLDRADAISVTDRCLMISGPPLYVAPEGSQALLVYAVEGAPGVLLTYSPRWRAGRYV